MAKTGDLSKRGVDFDNLQLNLGNLMQSKETAVTSLTGGIKMLFKANKVNIKFLIEHVSRYAYYYNGDLAELFQTIYLALSPFFHWIT